MRRAPRARRSRRRPRRRRSRPPRGGHHEGAVVDGAHAAKDGVLQLGETLALTDPSARRGVDGDGPDDDEVARDVRVEGDGYAALGDASAGGGLAEDVVVLERGDEALGEETEESGAQSRLRRHERLARREDEAANLLLGGVGVDLDARGVAEEVEGGEALGGGVGADEVGDAVVHGTGETRDVLGLHGVPDALADGPLPRAARLERGGRGVVLAGRDRGRGGALHVGHRRGVQREALGVVRRLVEGRGVTTRRGGGCPTTMTISMARIEAD